MIHFTPESYNRLAHYISTCRKVAIAVHVHPDGDAIGSGTALSCYLRNIGKEAVLVLPEKCPDSLRFILDSKHPESIIETDYAPEAAKAALSDCDLLFCLDMNSFNRTDALADALSAAGCPKILVDHHLDPSVSSFDLVFSETGTSSASELLFWILLKLEGNDIGKIPFHSLEALLAGMTTDTNNFANSVFPSTLKMASMLLECGVDRDAIVSELYNRYRENRIRAMGYLLSRKLTITPQGAAYMVLEKEEIEELGLKDDETEAFVNIPLAVDAVRMSIFLKEKTDGVFRVSLRSKKGTSANRCAALFFNGGGHELASGGRLTVGKDVADKSAIPAYIISCTEKFFNEDSI